MVGLPALLLLAAAPTPARPWTSADGAIRLVRPGSPIVAKGGAPLGALMAPGWRLLWNGAAPTPGTLAVRLVVPARPGAGPGGVSEVLQIGWSATSAARRTCLSYGLGGGRRLADRTIGGVRFAAWTHGDAGMSQAIAATDLRAVVRGRCYALARFSYAVRATDGPAPGAIPQARAAALLDVALASVQLRVGVDADRPRGVHRR